MKKLHSFANHLFTFPIALLFVALPFNVNATDINELEEITMQVIDLESIDEIDIQQMITLPAPVRNENVSHQTRPIANEQLLRSNIGNRQFSKPSNENNK